MNYKNIIYLGMFFLFTISFNYVYANVNNEKLKDKVIYLDPGHGGIDSGSVYKNIYEKDLNLILSNKLKDKLEELGATVYLTRDTDKDLATSKNNRKRSDLANRAYLINKTKPDLYLSIHLNYISNSKWQGLQIFYNNKNKENINIATKLTEYMRELTSNVRDIKYSNEYYMYKRINTPGVLIELGFLSNNNDRYRLTHEEYQDKLINQLAISIEKYFNG